METEVGAVMEVYSSLGEKKVQITQGEAEVAEFIMSKKGKPMIKLGRFTFYGQRKHEGKARWICSTHHNRKCKARIITDGNIIVSLLNQHNH